MNKKIKQIKLKIIKVLKQNGIVKAGIFGSYARGEQKKKSDVDILIQFKSKKSLFDLIRIEKKLEHLLKKKIDLITYKSINPLLKDKILKEEIRIL